MKLVLKKPECLNPKQLNSDMAVIVNRISSYRLTCDIHAHNTHTHKTFRHHHNVSLYAIHIGIVHSAAIAVANSIAFFYAKTVSESNLCVLSLVD